MVGLHDLPTLVNTQVENLVITFHTLFSHVEYHLVTKQGNHTFTQPLTPDMLTSQDFNFPFTTQLHSVTKNGIRYTIIMVVVPSTNMVMYKVQMYKVSGDEYALLNSETVITLNEAIQLFNLNLESDKTP